MYLIDEEGAGLDLSKEALSPELDKRLREQLSIGAQTIEDFIASKKEPGEICSSCGKRSLFFTELKTGEYICYICLMIKNNPF